MVDRSQIQEIKDRLDIVLVAQKYLRSEFKKSGRNTFTLCPFHGEKSPSFSLNSELGIYKCFGCNESGDVITFIQKMEGVEFPEALEIAAQIAGVTLKKEFSPQEKAKLDKKKKAIQAHKLATEFYNYLLLEHNSGKKALQYCEDRKIRKQELQKFKIGFAPNGFENLKKYLNKKGFTDKELVSFGLLIEKNSRIYDKFRNRLVFPIFNHRGDIVAFSGRTLEKDGIPKYLNSPETVIYKKSDIIYGLFQAKDSVRKNNFAIIAEGNVEPLSSTKVGIENVVVPMGTGLTENQLKLLKRYCDEIYFAFDSDVAGQSALIRAIKLANKIGFSIKAINLGDFKDPDDMIQSEPEKWPVVVSDAVDIIEYLIHTFKTKYNISSAQGKSDYIKEILPYIRSIADEVRTEHYLKEISELTNTNEKTIIKTYNKKLSDSEDSNSQSEEISHERMSKQQYLTSIAISFPKYIQKIKPNITNKILKDIIEALEDNDLKQVRDSIDTASQKLFDKLATVNLSHITDDTVSREIEKIELSIHKSNIKDEIQHLRDDIKDAEKIGEDITSQLQKLNNLLRQAKEQS